LGGRSEHCPYRVPKFLDAERLLEECWTLCCDEVTILWTRRRTSQKNSARALVRFSGQAAGLDSRPPSPGRAAGGSSESSRLCAAFALLDNGAVTLEGASAALLADERIKRAYLGR